MLKKVFFIYILIVFLLILLPINGKESKINHTYILKVRLDYIFHVLLFLPWMFFYLFIKQFNFGNYFNRFNWFILGLVFCIFAEFLQYYIPYRSFNLKDMAANCLGVVVSLIMFILYTQIKNNSEAVDN